MFIQSNMQAWICIEPTDMRRSFDGLSLITRSIIRQEPTSGHLFVFFNKRRDMVKILYWDSSGFCIWSKRLEVGSFATLRQAGDSHSVHLDRAHLLLLLEGIDIEKTRKRKHFSLKTQSPI